MNRHGGGGERFMYQRIREREREVHSRERIEVCVYEGIRERVGEKRDVQTKES